MPIPVLSLELSPLFKSADLFPSPSIRPRVVPELFPWLKDVPLSNMEGLQRLAWMFL